jgi:hypothetical protein
MADRITVLPEELRRAARAHRETADYLSTVPSNNAVMLATLESLGPVFADLRAAGSELLDQRRVCYERQAAAHSDLADQLSYAADVWEQHDARAARDLRVVSEGDV